MLRKHEHASATVKWQLQPKHTVVASSILQITEVWPMQLNTPAPLVAVY